MTLKQLRNQLLQVCAESEPRSESRRVGVIRDVMTVPNEKAVWPVTNLFKQTCVGGFRHLLG